MSLPDKHIAVWNLKNGPPIDQPQPPAGLRPAPIQLDSRNQWEFTYFVYRIGEYFSRYNQALSQNASTAQILADYQAFARSPSAPANMDQRGEGSQMAITNILISPQFDGGGKITGFQVEGIFPTGPGHPDDYTSSSSSRRP